MNMCRPGLVAAALPGALDAGPAHWNLILEPGADRRQLSLKVVQ
jgi:hypothetical protein